LPRLLTAILDKKNGLAPRRAQKNKPLNHRCEILMLQYVETVRKQGRKYGELQQYLSKWEVQAKAR
jgi:hypothetical protein